MRVVACILPLALVACATSRPDVAGAQRAMAREMLARKDYERAFAIVDPICRANSGDAEALAIRGVVYREQGLTAEARADLDEAVKRAPDLAVAHSGLAVLLETNGDAAAALEHHRKAAELERGNPAYLNNLGFSLFARGHAKEAIPVLREALRGAPMDSRIRNNLGFCYAATGDYALAAEQFERGGSLPEARNNLGYAYERRGNAGQAFELYVEALRLDPKSSVVRENLERVARRLGRELPADLRPASNG